MMEIESETKADKRYVGINRCYIPKNDKLGPEQMSKYQERWERFKNERRRRRKEKSSSFTPLSLYETKNPQNDEIRKYLEFQIKRFENRRGKTNKFLS